MPPPDALTLVKSEFFEPANKLLAENYDLLKELHWHDRHGEHKVKKQLHDATKQVAKAEKLFKKGLSKKLFDSLEKTQEKIRFLHATAFQYFGAMGADVEAYTSLHKKYHERADAVLDQLERSREKFLGKKFVASGSSLQQGSAFEEIRAGKSVVRIRVTNEYEPDDMIGGQAVKNIASEVMARIPRIVLVMLEAALKNNASLLPSSFDLNASLKYQKNARASLRLDSTPRQALMFFGITPSLLSAAEKGQALSDDPTFYQDAVHELTHFVDWHRPGEEHFNPELDIKLYKTMKDILGEEPSIAAIWLGSILERARMEAYAEHTGLIDSLEAHPTFNISTLIPDLMAAYTPFYFFFHSIQDPETYIDSLRRLRTTGETRLFGHFMLVFSWLMRLMQKGEVTAWVDKQGTLIKLEPRAVGTHLKDAKFSLEQKAINNLGLSLQKVRLNDWVSFVLDFTEACEYFGIKNVVTLEQIKKIHEETKKVFPEQVKLRTAA